jgi:hydrogenase-4 component B
MVVVMPILAAATVLLLFSGLPGLFAGRGSAAGERFSALLVLTGAALGTGATVAALCVADPAALELPWSVPGGVFSLAVDALSACFLFPIYLIAALGAVYGLGYWPQRRHPGNGRKLRLFFGLIAGAMTLVVTARNSLLFLVAWEVMALAGFFLVTTEEEKEEARRAGFIYLMATHAGTLALFGVFALLARASGSFAFPLSATLSSGGASAVFVLGLFGFGLKAGLMPLHVWLPGAHAAAPSHVSALLSGVMIKTGIYGLVRLTSFFADAPPWWGWTILLLGAASGVMGVLFAIAQHDIKRLLAYHSVENIGIIALGLGIALLGRSYGLPLLTVLGLSGALLHVINHGLFKSLLFLGAGSVIHATGTREIDRYGALLRPMPWTALFFLGGAVAISGLPPLNGFVSEWFIYLGLFQSLSGDSLALRLAVLAAPALALIGALALACFVKVFGVTFLGSARTPATSAAHEAPASMRWPMGVLLAACLLIGLWPAAVVPLLGQAAVDWQGAEPLPLALFAQVAPVTAISVAALMLLGILALAAWMLRRKAAGRSAAAPTWGCGYAFPTGRMQYTASSFAQMLTGLFAWGLRSERHGGEVSTNFPSPSDFSSHTPDTVLDRLLLPAFGVAARFCTWLRARLQHGITGIYLLYVALTLCLLLTLGALLRG